MRKNRSLIRKIVSEPIIKKRQEKITEAIKKDLEQKQNGSLTNLMKILTSKSNNKANDNNNDDDDVNLPVDEEEEETKVVQGENIVRYTGSKLTSLKVSKTKYTGSKPKLNPGKKLVWF